MLRKNTGHGAEGRRKLLQSCASMPAAVVNLPLSALRSGLPAGRRQRLAVVRRFRIRWRRRQPRAWATSRCASSSWQAKQQVCSVTCPLHEGLGRTLPGCAAEAVPVAHVMTRILHTCSKADRQPWDGASHQLSAHRCTAGGRRPATAHRGPPAGPAPSGADTIRVMTSFANVTS